MKRLKRGLLVGLLSILFINFVSAQFFSSFGRFSITGFLESIGPQDLTLFALFIIFFPIIFYALGKVFKDNMGQPNKAIAGVIAFGVAILIVYSVYRSGFDITGLFYGWGISTGFLYAVIPIFLLAFIIFGLWKKWFKISGFIAFLGLFLIIINMFTDIFYEKFTVFVIGFVLLLIGLSKFIIKLFKKKHLNPNLPPGQPPQIIEREKIIYQQKQRSLYDLKQKLNSYKFEYNNARGNPHRQKRIKQAMQIIEREIRRLS